MNGQNEKNKDVLPTKNYLHGKVAEYYEQCIECHRCIDVCPVTKERVSIKELNRASLDEQELSLIIKKFAFSCVQCGKCVPVCPKNIRRDLMVRYIKYKIKDEKPWNYTRYLFVKGPDLTGIKKIVQQLFIRVKKIMNKDLACFMETEVGKKADLLFYPGCYIYSTRTIRQTLRLLNHLDCSYSVLGGVTTCCGTPHMLQGEFDEADKCIQLLYEKIKACDPKIIITACAECFEVIEQIKITNKMDFEILSVAQYLLRYKDKFPPISTRGKIVIHDSCRFHRQSPQGIAARETVALFGKLVESPLNEPSNCCYQWNHGSDPGNNIRRINYLTAVKKAAPTLACTCLTCYEELKKIHTDVKIIDLLELFEETLNGTQSTE